MVKENTSPKKSAAKKSRKKVAKKAAKKKTTKKKEMPPEPEKESSTGLTIGIWIIVAIVVILVTAGIVRNTMIQKDVIVTVNGDSILAADIDEQMARLPPNILETTTREDVIEQTIDKVLVLQHAQEAGITVTDEQIDARLQEQLNTFGIDINQLEELLLTQDYTLEEYKRDLGELVLLDKIIEQEILPKAVVSEDDISSYYQENIDQFSAQEGQIRVRHLLVATEDEAFDAYDRALEGEDFVELAKELSTGPTGPNGGDLGFVSAESPLVTEFKEVALLLEVNEVSEPVETQFGWHLIFRDQDTIPLSEVRENIAQTLEQQLGRTLFEEFLAGLREEAKIKYFSHAE